MALEARPLLESRKFIQLESAPFPLYYSAQEDIFIIVSGMGKLKSSQATSYLGSRINIPAWLDSARQLGNKNSRPATYSYSNKDIIPVITQTITAIWINFGTCGHHKLPIGQGILVHKITDYQNGNNYYPLRLPYWESASIECHEKELTNYPQSCVMPNTRLSNNKQYNAYKQTQDNIVDMESAGFFSAACLFSHQELIQLYKVVADNKENPLQQIKDSPTKIANLLKKHLLKLNAINHELRKMADKQFGLQIEMEQQIKIWQDYFDNKFHWTKSQNIVLKELLRQVYIIDNNTNFSDEINNHAQNASQVLKKLQQRLDEINLTARDDKSSINNGY